MQQHSLRLLSLIQDKLSSSLLDPIAKTTGLLVRSSKKITPQRLLIAFSLLATYSTTSLSIAASILGWLAGTPISKQAVAKRLSPACIDFFRHALFASLASASRLPQYIQLQTFAHFNRVLIQDSTHIPLPDSLCKQFPGPKNQLHKPNAGLKIQTLYDALADAFLSFQLTPFTHNDQAASPDILPLLKPGDLLLRDLGYFVLNVFRSLSLNGIYFLSRLRLDVALFQSDGLTPLNLAKRLRHSHPLDLYCRIGSSDKILVRLLAFPLPPSVASQRRRKLRQNRDKRLHPSKSHLHLLAWDIYITNVPPHLWDTQTLSQIYPLRWRIETLFKSWKSHFKLALLPDASPYQVQALLLAKLLFITLFQTYLFPLLQQQILASTGRLLSLLKFASFLRHNFWFFLTNPDLSISHLLLDLIAKHCCYEKRNRLNYQQHLLSLG